MIAVRIDRKVENDNYRALALYVAGYTENNPAEKMLDSWVTGCVSEDFTDVLLEIEAVQGLACNTEKDKSYHLMLSFRPEDENRLSPKILHDIESRFTEALGFSEHQRCCGVHKNTNNIHMHLAINTVHPESFKIHEPYRDFFTLARVRKELEQEYGLVVDPGITKDKEPKRPNTKAQTMEAHSGQEAFDSYVQRHKAELMQSLAKAESWPDVHKTFAEYGIGIKPGRGRKSGLVLYDLHNKKHHLTASSLDRTTSGPAMVKRFGQFEAAQEKMNIQELFRYSKRPLQKEPDRNNLYQTYLATLAHKKAAYADLDGLKAEEQKRRSELTAKWNERRKELQQNVKLTSKDRWGLIQRTYLLQKEELAAAGAERKGKHTQIRAQYPFSSWVDYLKKEALQGHETALAILRSKQVKVEPAGPERRPVKSSGSQELLENTRLSTRDKKRLLNVNKLREKTGVDIKVSISPSGVLILALPSGGSIRDTGKQIYFSAFDPQAQETAKQYAKIRWGGLARKGKDNTYVLSPNREKGLER